MQIDLQAPATALVWQSIPYTLTISNSSELRLSDLRVQDTLPPGATFVAADSGGVLQDGVVTWQISTLFPFESLDLHFYVRVGQTYTLRQSLPSGQRLGVSEIVLYPGYDVLPYGLAEIDVNDLALLRLATPVALGPDVAPVTLATAGDASRLAPGVLATITGWGNRSGKKDVGDFPAELQQAQVPVISNQACQQAYAGKFTVEAGMLCAGLSQGGVDACAGDTGGPLVVPDGHGGWLQAGITSFRYNLGCGKPNQPGIYTRVPLYTDWIQQALNRITNSNYRVTSSDGFKVVGNFAVETQVRGRALYLPMIVVP